MRAGATVLRPALGVLLILVIAGLIAPSAVAGLTVKMTVVSRIGAGAARLTVYTTGTARLYVNLKGLAPGTWSEQLWSGSCSAPSRRVGVLPGLIVPATGRVARTNALTAAQATGRTLRLVRGSTVLCTTFAVVQAGNGTSGDSLLRYVSTTGSDSNPGTAASPWRTLQKAANSARAGSTVTVLSGTYSGFVMRRSGTADAPIVLRGAGSTMPRIVADGTPNVVDFVGNHDVTLTGFDISGAAGPRETGAGVRVEGGAHDIRIADSTIHHNTTQGVNVQNATRVTVTGNDVHHNQIGIQVTGSGEGVEISRNDVHENDRMVVNTPAPDDDYGGVGIALVNSTGSVLVSGNRVWGNRAVSHDYQWDGGAFEIFAASHVTIRENTTWDNENILETGSNGANCVDNVFARNVSYGATSVGRTLGIFLRCAVNMKVVNNTIVNLDSWVFSIGPVNDTFGSSIDGLQIVNNIAVMATGKIYGIEMELPSSVAIHNNLVRKTSGGEVATVLGKGSTASVAQLRSWIGQTAGDIDADPKFVDAGQRDFRLQAGSPAIDQGVVVSGITNSYAGLAPDMGRYETTSSPSH